MSWHQNGPGSKAYELFSDGRCDMGHEDCYPTMFAIVRPIPAHQLWVYYEGEKYDATRETRHAFYGTWVEEAGSTRTQAEAKDLCEQKWGELF